MPSPAIFDLYLADIAKQNNLLIDYIKFRNKDSGWMLVDNMTFLFKNKEVLKTKSDKYLYGFSSNLFLRPSCTNCIGNNFRSGSDITIGDYWGGNTKLGTFDDSKGISVAIIKSLKGMQLFKSVERDISIAEASLSHIVKFNKNIYTSTIHSKLRASFFNDFENGTNISCLLKNYVKTPLAKKVKEIIGSEKLFWIYNYLRK